MDLPHETVGAAVEVVRGDDVVARTQPPQHGVDGGDARCEGDAVGCALEAGEVGLERGARRVRDAGVLVAEVLARGCLHVRAREVDGRHDGARRGVRSLPGVDGARGEGPVGVGGVRGGGRVGHRVSGK